MSSQWTDGRWDISLDLDRPCLAETMDDIFYPTTDANGDLRIAWEDKRDLLRVIETHNAVSRLSPAVRELLLTNPEAVEKAVEAAVAHKALNAFLVAFNPTEPHTVELRKQEQELKRHLQEIRCKYIAALSKPGRDDG